MGSRKGNGEGSIYRRADGRWAGAAFVETVNGERKRIQVLGRVGSNTRQDVHDRLEDKLAETRRGVRTPDKEWTVGAYLDYWLHDVAAVKNRPRTIELYEAVIRLHLKPALGSIRLMKLTVQDVQTALNRHVERTGAVRTAQVMRNVLRAALNRAEREELVPRNVAKYTDAPFWQRKPIQPWTAEEAAHFLSVAQQHRLYPAFVMLVMYGMRRGEVLGLRWCDVDFAEDRLHVRQQLQRVGNTLQEGPVKTAAGRRDLPLIKLLADELAQHYISSYDSVESGRAVTTEIFPDPNGFVTQAKANHSLVFLSSAGTPIDPQNFVRMFHAIRKRAGLPRITVHHTRHTAATLLKNLHVPVRDTQLILGHSRVTTTLQLYEHGDIAGQIQAITHLGAQLLTNGVAVKTAVNRRLSTGESAICRALTPGGAYRIRTDDLLRAILILIAESLPFTPVINHARTRVYTHIFGWVAVKTCCHFDSSASLQTAQEGAADDWIAILRALKHVEDEAILQKTLPFNLMPIAQPNP
jgi:integrase